MDSNRTSWEEGVAEEFRREKSGNTNEEPPGKAVLVHDLRLGSYTSASAYPGHMSQERPVESCSNPCLLPQSLEGESAPFHVR